MKSASINLALVYLLNSKQCNLLI